MDESAKLLKEKKIDIQKGHSLASGTNSIIVTVKGKS